MSVFVCVYENYYKGIYAYERTKSDYDNKQEINIPRILTFKIIKICVCRMSARMRV